MAARLKDLCALLCEIVQSAAPLSNSSCSKPPSKIQFACHLHFAGRKVAVGTIDEPELPAIEIVIRTSQRHPVKRVVHLPTKLEAVPFGKGEVLTERSIPGVDSWTERPFGVLASVAL